MNTVLLVGIAGSSGSGKTTLARNLMQRLGSDRAAIIQEDSYYRDLAGIPLAERAARNFDHPDAFEHELLARHLQDLRSGRSVSVPVYDYTQHCRRAALRPIEPRPVILVEGIMVLAVPRLRAIMDVGVFVDTPLDICLVRRLERDLEERDRTVQSVLQQYRRTVRPMYEQFIKPARKHADLRISGEDENSRAADHLVRDILARLRNARVND